MKKIIYKQFPVEQRCSPFINCSQAVEIFLSLVTLTFVLDIQTRPSDGPNTSSLWIWHKSVQRFPRYFIHKRKSHRQCQKQNLMQFIACGNKKNTSVVSSYDLITMRKVVRQFSRLEYHCIKWYTSGPIAYRLRLHWWHDRLMSSLLWHCWFGVRKSIQPVKKFWVMRCWRDSHASSLKIFYRLDALPDAKHQSNEGKVAVKNIMAPFRLTVVFCVRVYTCLCVCKAARQHTIVRLKLVSCAPVVEVLIKRPHVKYQLGFSVQNGVVSTLTTCQLHHSSVMTVSNLDWWVSIKRVSLINHLTLLTN